MKKVSFLLFLIFASVEMQAQSKRSDKYFAKGIEAYNNKDYARAIDWFSKANALDKKEITPTSYRYTYSESWLAHCYHLIGDDAKAKKISQNYYYVTPADRRLTVESDKEGDRSNKAIESGNLQDALHHAIKCMELEKEKLGEESLHYIGSCLAIANIHNHMNNPTLAISYCDKGLNILTKLGFKNDIYTFQLLQTRVFANVCQNMLTATYSDMLKLKSICEYEDSVNGNKYPTALIKLLEGRIVYQGDRDLNLAAHLSQEAFNLAVQSYSSNNENIFMTIKDCIIQLSMIGRYDLILNSIPNALISLENQGITNGHKGILLSFMGDFSKEYVTGLKYHEQAALLLKDSQYEDNYYSNQCMIADEYVSDNRVNEAIDLLENVCLHYQNSNKNNGTYRQALINLGDIYLSMGRTVDAASKYKSVLTLLADNKSHPDYMLALLKWAPISTSSCNNSDANQQYSDGYKIGVELNNILSSNNIQNYINYGIGVPQLASAILPFFRAMLSKATINSGISWYSLEKKLREFIYQYLIPESNLHERTTCDALMLLAHINFLLGNSDEALSISGQVIDISKEEGWDYRNYLHDRAFYQYYDGDIQNAYSNFRIGFDLQKENILKNYRWMTLGERTAYTNARRGNLDNLPHYAAITPNDSRYAELAYDALLFTKGLLLNSTIELHSLLQEEGDEKTLEMFSGWTRLNQQLQISENAHKFNTDNLRNKILLMEKQLLERSQIFGDYTKGLDITFKDVQAKLQANDMAIEFFSYYENATDKQYGAIILTKESKPQFVCIGSDASWRHIDISKECYESSELFDVIFDKMKKYMPTKEIGNIYFAADGILHKIAIENLPGAENYNFRRLSSTREIALAKDTPYKVSSIALFGGISYGLGEVASYYQSANNGYRNSDNFLINLPGTKVEAEQIRSLLKNKIKSDLYIEKAASKRQLIKYSGKCADIIHIATHGFFCDTISDHIDKDPLTLSGLCFAGAQNSIWGMDTDKLKDNGILTSHEISVLDLRGLRLAVLSACETGLGQLNPDGVFGLQRGFKQAGAKAIMMSLWKVTDAATQLLMIEFYKNLIIGKNQYDALRNAQSVVRKSYPEPKDWAAFVLIDANNNLTF